jgi:hypothetical protein
MMSRARLLVIRHSGLKIQPSRAGQKGILAAKKRKRLKNGGIPELFFCAFCAFLRSLVTKLRLRNALGRDAPRPRRVCPRASLGSRSEPLRSKEFLRLLSWPENPDRLSFGRERHLAAKKRKRLKKGGIPELFFAPFAPFCGHSSFGILMLRGARNGHGNLISSFSPPYAAADSK